MKLKIVLGLLITSLTLGNAFAFAGQPNNDTIRPLVKPRLPHSFGTVLQLKVGIVVDLTRKEMQGEFLVKILAINNSEVNEDIIMRFKDETKVFPSDDFELYKYLYGKTTGSLDSKQVAKMRKEYVGKVFNIVAYETGEFTGVPEGYFKYQPVRQDMGFHFRNYLVIISKTVSN